MERIQNSDVGKTKKMKVVDALAARLPFRPSLALCWRWQLKGVNGVRLKTERCGQIWMTTLEDVDEFLRLRCHGTESSEHLKRFY